MITPAATEARNSLYILTQTTKEQSHGHRGAVSAKKVAGYTFPVIRGRRRAETSRDGQCRLEHFASGMGTRKPKKN